MALTDAQKAKLLKLGQLAKFKAMADTTYQAAISDLSTIRSGAAAGATAYQKPASGIPATDMTEAVQGLLTAAGTALQAADLTTLEGKVAALEAYFDSQADSDTIINKWNEIVDFLSGITESQTLDGIISGINTSIAAKYTKPSGGIPKTDLAEDVQTSLGKADTALQSHQDISGKADKSEMSVTPGTGSNADKTTIQLKSGTSATVLTAHQDISGKANKVAVGTGTGQATAGNFFAIGADGDLVDSGKKAADFQAAGNYKTTQSAVSDPSADGDGVSFIDSITQNTNGVITPHKKNVQSASASQAGLMSAAHYSKLDAIEYATDSDIEDLFS